MDCRPLGCASLQVVLGSVIGAAWVEGQSGLRDYRDKAGKSPLKALLLTTAKYVESHHGGCRQRPRHGAV